MCYTFYMRLILHLDMDAFFTSIEQREHPYLKGKPVVVGALPKGGRGRGVVSTASYEARKFGIHSGQPISIAYRLNPKAIFLPVNFTLYMRTSQNLMEILKTYSEKIEVAGLDEAYLDLSQKVTNYEEARFEALKIKSDILKKEKLTCSIGLGPNKLIAKIASDFKKPNGLTVVKPEKAEVFLSPLPVEKIPGVGPKSKEVLNKLGIMTIADLRKLPEASLQKYFGKWGLRLYETCRGIDESELIEKWEIKSAGREITFERDTRDHNLIFATLNNLIEETLASLKTENLRGQTLALKVRYRDFETHTKQKRLKENSDDQTEIKKTARELMLPFLEDKRPIRLIGVRFSKLLPNG